MAVERHESAKESIKDGVLASFKKELGDLKESLPQPKAKEKAETIVWKKTTETVKGKIDEIVNAEKNETKNEKPEVVQRAASDLKNYSNPYNFELAAQELAQNENLSKILADIQNEALQRGFNLNEEYLDGMDALLG